MRFHCLGLPHTVTNKDYNACAFTQKVLKFCKMMHKDHTVFHYGHEDSQVDCTEHITILTNEDLQKTYGSYDWRKNFFTFSSDDHCHTKFNEEAIPQIRKRLQKGDFVLCFWGGGHNNIAQTLKDEALIVEPGVGNYCNPVTPYRVYESYACMHHALGKFDQNPTWYQVVIPNYFDTDEFEFEPEKSDYFLFLGRISECKGIHIAIQACAALKCKLVVAGQGEAPVHDCVEYVGYADSDMRKKLMKNAKALLIFSNYCEPFGGVTIEALLSGTPVICPDYGCFSETIPHGKVGYRVRTFEHITWAMQNVDKIDPYTCRAWGMQYSLEEIQPRFEEYFQQLGDLYGEGWYTKRERKNLIL